MLKPAVSTPGGARLRVYPLALFVAVFAALVVACGGSSEDPKLAANPPLSGQTPLEMLKRSTESMRALESFRADAEMEIEALGQEISVSMEMEVSHNNRVHNVMLLATPDGKQAMEQILAQPYAYTKLRGEDWFRIDLGSLVELSGGSDQVFSDPRGFANSFFPAENIPWELYDVSSKGRDSIDGVQAEHLSIQFDFQELWGQLDSATRGQFGQSFGVGGVDVEQLVRRIEMKRLDFWVDGQGYNRKVAIEMLMGDTMSVTMDMRMFDFNKEVVIDVPTEYTELPSS